MSIDSSAVIVSPGNAALVLDSPHSGAEYPVDFRPACPLDALRSVEDAFVDQLWNFAPKLDVAFVAARFPRSYIDANRSLLEIDPLLLDEPWPGPMSGGPKVRLGKGLVWRMLDDGTAIYDRSLSVQEVQQRIERCWQPYHDALTRVLDDCHRRHGQVIHLNCHSMPAVADKYSTEHPWMAHADFVLGDRDGTSADPRLTRWIERFLNSRGYAVSVNHPYKGVELVRKHGRPAEGRHSIQIEVKKRLYMDENTQKLHAGFLSVRRVLLELSQQLLRGVPLHDA